MLDNPVARWVIQQLLNGNAFYLAMAMLTAACLMRWLARDTHERWRIGSGIVGVVGAIGGVLLLMTLSFLGFFWMLYLIALAVFAIWARKIEPRGGNFVGLAVLFGFGVFYTDFADSEPPGNQPAPIVVYGDSLSAPLGVAPAQTWPALVGAATGRPVDNRAVAGNRVADALTRQLEDPVSSSTVLVLIGGNDQLGGTPALEYGRTLGTLIGDLHEHDNTVIVLSTPVTPTRPHMGWLTNLQVALADAVAPRRLVTDALFADPGMTSDGLHLSVEGHATLARKISEYITKP